MPTKKQPKKESRKKDGILKNENRHHLEETQVAWHPAFVVALEQELEKYKNALVFDVEYHLTTESLRVDLIVIKKVKDITIGKNIAAIFKAHNLLEYKSPDSYVSIHDFNKGYDVVRVSAHRILLLGASP
jgi:hypothetical protein